MNRTTRAFTNGMSAILLCCMLQAACSPQAPVSLTPTSSVLLSPISASPTLVPPTAPVPLHTNTPTGTASLSLQEVNEPAAIAPCRDDGTGDKQTLDILFTMLAPNLLKMDSFRYHTLYRYKLDDQYADDELSVDVVGEHSGFQSLTGENPFYYVYGTSPGYEEVDPDVETPTPEEINFFYPLASQAYERSHVIYTDLSNQERTETIITQDGFASRQGDDTTWMSFNSGKSSAMLNMADLFSPQMVISFMIGGGGWLSPGWPGASPVMAQTETLNGREVIHRCWRPPVVDSSYNAGVIHFDRLITFLSNAEIHLWTTKDDSQLVRFVLTGDHSMERLAERDFIEHDTPRNFLLWMDLYDVGSSINIEMPSSDQVLLAIPSESNQPAASSAPYDELPLPPDSTRVGVLGETELIAVTREYSWIAWTILDSVLEYSLKPGWYQISADRRPIHEVEIGITEAAAFYMDEMGRRGWSLKSYFYQLGLPALYLFFERDGIAFPVILETRQQGVTHISAILPPPDDTLEAILAGWTTYTTQNSGLSGDMVGAIAFDAQGNAWIATDKGLDYFDGKTWTVDKKGADVRALAVDPQGQVWSATGKVLYVLDGDRWQAFQPPADNIQDIAIDSKGRVWLELWGFGVSMFDGKTFTNYSPKQIGMPGGHNVECIASDLQGNIWIGTDGGGVYKFDGKAWITALKAKAPPHTEYVGMVIDDLAIDRQGQPWIATREGLSVYDGKDWFTYTPQNSGMPFQWVEAIAIDPADRVWVGGDYGAVSVLEADGSWYTYTPLQQFATGRSMYTLEVDPQGRIWVGSDQGLNVFTPPPPTSTSERVLPKPTPLPPTPTPTPIPEHGWTIYLNEYSTGMISGGPSIRLGDMLIDQGGNIWVAGGSSGLDGLHLFDGTQWSTQEGSYWDLALDPNGQIWAVAIWGGGLTVFDGQDWKTYTSAELGIKDEQIRQVEADSNGRVWVLVSHYEVDQFGEIVIRQGKPTIVFSHPEFKLTGGVVKSLDADKQGRIWAAVYDDERWAGLNVFDGTNLQQLTEPEMGLQNVVRTVFDDQGRAWVATKCGGLMTYDGQKWAVIVQEDNACASPIDGITIDSQGRVWAWGLSMTVFLLDGNRWIPLDVENSDLEFPIFGLVVDKQNRMWVGASGGVSVISVEDLLANP